MASETAQGTNIALSQSFAQTEIWFKFHEDLMTKVLQTSLNIMQWTELKKPESILNYLNSELDNVFFKINKNELLRNLMVNVTSAKEDKDMVENLKQLMQPAMQNGADLVEMAEILSANTENKLKDILKKIQERKEKREGEINQMEQQKMQQSQEQFQQQQEMLQAQHEEAIANENANKQADRENKIAVATITTIGFEKNDETNTVDIEGASTLALKQSKQNFEQLVQMQKLKHEDKRLRLEEETIKSRERMARMKPKKK